MYKQMELFPKEFNPIEEYAKLGSGISGGKERIKDFFEHNKSLSERIEFLKNEYGTGGFLCSREPRKIYQANADHSKHVIRYCDEYGNNIMVRVTYKQLAEIIVELIKRGEYI